jgi:hypothetical protein
MNPMLQNKWLTNSSYLFQLINIQLPLLVVYVRSSWKFDFIWYPFAWNYHAQKHDNKNDINIEDPKIL